MRTEWEKQQGDWQRFIACISAAVRNVEDWIPQITDPEAGKIGEWFAKNLTNSDYHEEIDIEHSGSLAVYTSFSLSGWQPSFVNKITYGPKAPQNAARLFLSMVHEKAHVQQVMTTPAFHANPYNRRTKILLCPRDYAILRERTEQHAYVMQSLFGSNVPDDMKAEFHHVSYYDSLSVGTFGQIRAANGDLRQTLIEAAEISLLKPFTNPPNGVNFADHYHEVALKNYEAALKERAVTGESGDYVFVRFDPADILDIGEMPCGYNGFSPDGTTIHPSFLATAIPHPENAAKLQELNEKLGILNEDMLPTLSEALLAQSLTRIQFMDEKAVRNRTSAETQQFYSPVLALGA